MAHKENKKDLINHTTVMKKEKFKVLFHVTSFEELIFKDKFEQKLFEVYLKIKKLLFIQQLFGHTKIINILLIQFYY